MSFEDKILILDFGSQYTSLIARRLREIGIFSEIQPFTLSEKAIQDYNPKGIILSGGPETVTGDKTPRAPEIVFTLGCPVLGICYGMQTMAQQFGGMVEVAENQEFGHAILNHDTTFPLFQELPENWDVWMSHGDHVVTLPPDFIGIGNTTNTSIAAMASTKMPFYAVQFHPEVTHTRHGEILLKNFAHTICGCSLSWDTHHMIDTLVANIQAEVAQDQVLLALSGGVDSSVLGVLLHKALGSQVTGLFVDTGLMGSQDMTQIWNYFREIGMQWITVDAKEIFFERLHGITDPEQKRKIIGKTFIEVFEAETIKHSNMRWLAQGTIYPDVIESAKESENGLGKTRVIKSHHNVGGLPAHMTLKLLEPFREFFKDEVKKVGEKLNMPSHILHQHPFPGPGLAVRILGEVTEEAVLKVRHADKIFLEELKKHDWHANITQAFAVFLPIKSVGVKGDERCYDNVIALRAVETIDFMTAQWAQIPHDVLSHIANRIINEVPGIARVVYDISSKPPATIEWE